LDNYQRPFGFAKPRAAGWPKVMECDLPTTCAAGWLESFESDWLTELCVTVCLGLTTSMFIM